MPPSLIQLEQMIALREKVGGGRSHRPGNYLYMNLKDELDHQEQEFEDSYPRGASVVHSHALIGDWVRPETVHRTALFSAAFDDQCGRLGPSDLPATRALPPLVQGIALNRPAE